MKLKEIDAIIKPTIERSIKGDNLIEEAYVAETKTFKQVSEHVSQKTKTAHVELYTNYVQTMNRVSAELDTANRAEANQMHSQFKSLKCDEAFNMNATWLHELYFANCFDPHSEIAMDTQSYMKLQRDFSTFDDWQRDFIACASAVGEGWAVCGWHSYLKRYVNTFVHGHCDSVLIGLHPVIVIDMWSHAYFRDYSNDKQSYIIAMMRELNWQVIEDRIKKTEMIAQVMK